MYLTAVSLDAAQLRIGEVCFIGSVRGHTTVKHLEASYRAQATYCMV